MKKTITEQNEHEMEKTARTFANSRTWRENLEIMSKSNEKCTEIFMHIISIYMQTVEHELGIDGDDTQHSTAQHSTVQ